MSAGPVVVDQLKGFALPPMPESLQRLRAETAQEFPDMQRIVNIISGDASLAAEVLKTVNSPAFRRSRPLNSIPNAVMMLGMTQVLNITVTVGLRSSFGGQGRWVEQFWEVAGDVALAMGVLAREVSGIPEDTAYTLGLLHDCGIPLLMLPLPAYDEVLKAAGRDPDHTVIEIEHSRFGMHHAWVGAHLGQAWNLDPSIARAIGVHHNYRHIRRPQSGVEQEVVTLVGMLKMAEQVSNAYRGMAYRNVADDHEWARVGDAVLDYFDLSSQQYDDLTDTIIDLLSDR